MIPLPSARRPAAPWCPALVLAALAVAVTSCTEPPATELDSPTGADLTFGTASCAAPCVEVTVKFQGSPPTEEVVVSLVHVADLSGDRNDGTGTRNGALIKLTSDHEARFEDLDEGLYYALVRGIPSLTTALGAGTYTAPNAEPPVQSLAYFGAITSPRGRSVVLNKQHLFDALDDPPIEVTSTSAVAVSLTLKPSAVVAKLECLFYDGDQTQGTAVPKTDCPVWMLMDVTTRPDGTPVCTDGTGGAYDCAPLIPWFDREAGVKPGLLYAGALGNEAEVVGAPSNETVQYEIALSDPDGSGEQYTASLTDRKTAAGGNKDGVSYETAELFPLLCVDNFNTDESIGDAPQPGVDFGEFHWGYYGSLPLEDVLFYPNPSRTAIYAFYSGGGSVTLKARLKKHLLIDEDPDLGSETISVQITYDFPATCGPTEQPAFVSRGGPGDEDLFQESVECRADLKRPGVQLMTWSFVIPESREMEFSLEAASNDAIPPPSKEEETRARALVEFPGLDSTCPLHGSTIGKSTDPKWDIVGIG